MNIIQIDGYGFLIPSSPSRYRGNCSKEWGQFVGGNILKDMTCSEAEKAGLTKGKFVEMAVCQISTKTLTFEPNYLNEEFMEIWGIPVAGEMKTQFHEKASELSTFLMHRQSKDKFTQLTEQFVKDALNKWASEGMKTDFNSYSLEKIRESYNSLIFRFEMSKTESRTYGSYFYIASSYREPVGEFELAALKAAKEIQSNSNNCQDQRLVENQAKCFASIAENELNQVPVAQLNATNNKQLKSAKA
ncbi:hypothetical protein PA905_33880 [Planktothrix agardhii CCAP 1459/11A]|uniref:Uncharacterized protein n=1 Tax=Planktothrix agardhii CCAP 1459/11A TaxID=282420 RepID=A0A4V0XUV4_PLAAG|nr:hypothetical protein [Planktothrix agardhii]GDZ95149.1 hypothetical protein PA905_33880 [Planktothrix agardhii CCAP 1459/11A]